MIKRLKIRDFKSIRNLDLELDPVTVFVGRSGTGKSNIVQALRFLRNALLDFNQAVNLEQGTQYIAPKGADKAKTAIEVTFSLPGQSVDYCYAAEWAHQHGNMQLWVERLVYGKDTLYSRSRSETSGWVWEKHPEPEGQKPAHDRPMLDAFPAYRTIVFAHAALSGGIGYYHFPASALMHTSDPQHDMLKKVPGLWDDAANYRNVMRSIVQDFHNPHVRSSLLASLQAVDPSIESIELNSVVNPNFAVVGHKAGNRIIELHLQQESDGLRRFYAHLLALYQTPAKLTLVFEEPENAIYPGALSLLADEFRAAPRDNRGQVLLTTHNPALLDRFDVDNVRVVEMRDGQTVAGRVSAEQREAVKEQLMTTGDILRVDRARMDEKPDAPLVA